MDRQPWNLVADIGGTNARFAVASDGELALTKTYSVADYGNFSDAARRFLEEVAAAGGWLPAPGSACLALAATVGGEVMHFTNSPWVVDRSVLSRLWDGAPVLAINDFEAVGYAVTGLDAQDWVQLGKGAERPGDAMAVLGPGTGLGVCTVVPVDKDFKVLAGEGGHVDFAPVDDREVEILRLLSHQFGRVSAERLLSGNGIVNIYRALCAIHGTEPEHSAAAEVTAAALGDRQGLAGETLESFCRVLGSVAGNLALTVGARGGVYVAGGIVPRFVEFLAASGFLQRFRAKGRFETYLTEIPVRVVTRPDLGLCGALKKLTLREAS